MAVAGESVGGNMTAALALMAKERGDVTFVQQSMYYPVTARAASQVAVLGDGVFCDQGDSGSLVLEETGPTVVGLLWGRNKQSAFAPAGKMGYFTEIRTVQAQLGFSTMWP